MSLTNFKFGCIFNQGIDMCMRPTTFLKSILLNVLIAFSGINVATANTNASGLTGQYSCVINRQLDAFTSNLNGEDKVGLGMIFYIDYSKNTGSIIITLVDKFGTTGAVGNQKTSNFTFTEVKVPTVPNTYLATPKLPDGSTMDFFMMPVNSGNSILISSGGSVASKAPWTGICQKV